MKYTQIEDIFSTLGFSEEEAALFKMRSTLIADLRQWFEDSGLTQAKAAKQLGITQPRLSALLRGKWDQFSLEALITLATRAGHKVELHSAA